MVRLDSLADFFKDSLADPFTDSFERGREQRCVRLVQLLLPGRGL